MEKTKHIVLIAPPNTSIMDVAGPLDVFAKTMEYLKENMSYQRYNYTIHVLSIDDSKTVYTSSGLPIVCEGGLASVNYLVDTVIIAGRGILDEAIRSDLIHWLVINQDRIRRICSICSGAFILAEAGLLNGKRAATHWRFCDTLQGMYPEVSVDKDSIYVKDGKIYTSAGISTGIDLSLFLVEEDFGRKVAVMVARQLVLYLKRPGNQSQFSTILEYQKVDYEPVRNAQEWIIDHLDSDLSVEQLAELVSMSPRNFARVFVRETGVTPAKYVEKIRLETARRRLEETKLTVDAIATECGVSSADSLRRLFIRHLSITPTDYRSRFSSSIQPEF